MIAFRHHCLLWIIFAAAFASADGIPTPIRLQVERSRPAKFNFPIKRGESINFIPRFYDYNTPCDLSQATDIGLFYRQQGDTNLYYLAGTTTTNAGELIFYWTPASELTNTTYLYEVLVAGITNTTIRQDGVITMLPNLGYTAPATNPTPINIIDCATVLWLNAGLAPTNIIKFIQGPTGEPGPQGPAGTAVTNITIQIITNLNQTIMSMTVTNITIGGGGGAGSYTNTEINGTAHTNGIRIGDSPNSHWSLGTDGVWRVDMSTNGLRWVVDGDLVGEVTSNGTVMYKGSLELWEEDLTCNVRAYDGTRQAPSFSYQGHPNEFGTYCRGYGGHYVQGWSVAGNEVGILHAGGLTLMDTNASFVGRLVGNISGCSGYPEPIFQEWRTNMVFSSLTLSNLVVNPGLFKVNDINGTTRVEANNSGELYLKTAGGITRTKAEPGTTTHYSTIGNKASELTAYGLTLYDQLSGQPLLVIQNNFLTMKTVAGLVLWSLDLVNGLKLYNEATPSFASVELSYLGLTLRNSSSQTVFSVNNVTSNTVMQKTAITNSGSLTFYGPNGTNLLTLSGLNGNITSKGLLTMVDAGGTNWLTASNRNLNVTGNLRMNNVQGPTGFYTNLTIGNKTQVWMMVSGVITNIITL